MEFNKSHDDSPEMGKLVGNTGRYPIADNYQGKDITVFYSRNVSGTMPNSNTAARAQAAFFNTDGVQMRIRILKELVRNIRHKIVGLILPFDSYYIDLEIYDVVRYIPNALEGEGKMYEWIIYEKKVSVSNNNITLMLIEKMTTSELPGGN